MSIDQNCKSIIIRHWPSIETELGECLVFAGTSTTAQSQKAVSTYFAIKQILLFAKLSRADIKGAILPWKAKTQQLFDVKVSSYNLLILQMHGYVKFNLLTFLALTYFCKKHGDQRVFSNLKSS